MAHSVISLRRKIWSLLGYERTLHQTAAQQPFATHARLHIKRVSATVLWSRSMRGCVRKCSNIS